MHLESTGHIKCEQVKGKMWAKRPLLTESGKGQLVSFESAGSSELWRSSGSKLDETDSTLSKEKLLQPHLAGERSGQTQKFVE